MGPTTTGFGQETGYIMDWSPNNFRADLLCGIENQALSCTPKGNSESSMNHTCIYFWNLEHLENMQTAHKFEPRTSNCEVDMLTTRLPGCLVYTLSITNTQYCVCCFCITDISVSECIKCFYVRVYVTLPPQCWILPLVIDKQKSWQLHPYFQLSAISSVLDFAFLYHTSPQKATIVQTLEGRTWLSQMTMLSMFE